VLFSLNISGNLRICMKHKVFKQYFILKFRFCNKRKEKIIFLINFINLKYIPFHDLIAYGACYFYIIFFFKKKKETKEMVEKK